MEELTNNVKELPQLSINKTIYLVVVENVSFQYNPLSTHYEAFFSSKADKVGNFLEIIGYKVDLEEARKIRSNRDAISLVEKGDKELYAIQFPFTKIVSITNISYFQRNLDK